MTPEVLAFVSLVRAVGDSALRAKAAVLLGEPVGSCWACGHPVLADDVCLCLQFRVVEHESAPNTRVGVRVRGGGFWPLDWASM